MTCDSNVLDSIKNVDDYLARFAPELAARVTRELRPLYDPSQEAWHPRFKQLARRAFQAQGDAVMGLNRVLEKQKFTFVVGEMGVGKTLIASALSYVHLPDRSRTLILCPGHLVQKWAREVGKTVPEAVVGVVNRVSALFHLDQRRRPQAREFYVLARDRAKLGYRRRPAFTWRRRPYRTPPRGDEFDRSQYIACPQCAEFIVNSRTRAPITQSELAAKQVACKSCGSPLWQADPAGVRRYAPAEYIKRRLKGVFDLFVADEVHELKGADTAQGNVLGMLAAAAKKTVCLTGTLVGGYAEHLFYVLYRVNAAGMLAEGLKYSQVQDWIARYGSLETVTKTRMDSGSSLVYARGSKSRTYVRHRPGVSPLVFARHLLPSSVFVELADVAEALPPLDEDVKVVPMSADLADAYKDIEQRFKALMGDRSKWQRLMGAYMATLLSYPDKPYDVRDIPHVGAPRELPRDAVYPKERALLDLVAEELAERRRVWVFATFTSRRDVTERLASLLRRRNIRAAVLKQDTVQMGEREAWIAEQVRRGVDVIVSNPELVKTGLDLIAFPTLAFYETGYNAFTLMQASRRSWRVGQTEPVRVRYFCYRQTLQEAALRLMGAKVKATMTLQGKFSAEGLVALTQSEDMMTALARALVEGLDGVESAESYWRSGRKAARAAVAAAPAAILHSTEPQLMLF